MSGKYCYEQDNNGDYENEDVISFCDLPMYNSSTAHDSSIDHHEDSFKESCDSRSSSDEDQDSLFEFFSDEWNVAKNTNGTVSNKLLPSSISSQENIMFFGKIIQKHNEVGKSSIIVSKSRKNVVKRSREQVMVPKASVYTVPLKSKLLLVLFGLPPKVPKDQTEILSDLRDRQSRHAPTTFFAAEGGCEAVVPVRRRSGENGMWRLVRAASCFGSQNHTKVID